MNNKNRIICIFKTILVRRSKGTKRKTKNRKGFCKYVQHILFFLFSFSTYHMIFTHVRKERSDRSISRIINYQRCVKAKEILFPSVTYYLCYLLVLTDVRDTSECFIDLSRFAHSTIEGPHFSSKKS